MWRKKEKEKLMDEKKDRDREGKIVSKGLKEKDGEQRERRVRLYMIIQKNDLF